MYNPIPSLHLIIIRILRSFIEDGSVSMSSMADDKIDFLYR